MNKNVILLITILLLLTSCTTPIETDGIILTTEDKIQLAATYEQGTNNKAVILLHMLGDDRSSYDELTTYLNYNSYTVLAIDFRGHGESELDYTTFTDEDWQLLLYDVKASTTFLEEEGYTQIAVIGASIGANAGFNHAVVDERIDMGIFLSAGSEYKGIKTLDISPLYSKPGFFVASYEDKDAAVTATQLFNFADTEHKDIKLFTSGHGTELLGAVLGEDILYWLENYY
jgi:esterase/lipase